MSNAGDSFEQTMERFVEELREIGVPETEIAGIESDMRKAYSCHEKLGDLVRYEKALINGRKREPIFVSFKAGLVGETRMKYKMLDLMLRESMAMTDGQFIGTILRMGIEAFFEHYQTSQRFAAFRLAAMSGLPEEIQEREREGLLQGFRKQYAKQVSARDQEFEREMEGKPNIPIVGDDQEGV